MGPTAARDRAVRRPEVGPVLRVITILCLAIFAAEWLLPWTIAVGGLYILPVLLCLWLTNRRTSLIVASLCTALTLSGLAFATSSDVFWQILLNRSVVVFAIWVTANLGLLRGALEAELEESRETTATTLKSIGDGVITTDPTGTITFLNAAAEKLTGWTAAEALGRPLSEVFRRPNASPTPAQGEEALSFSDSLPSVRETTLVTRAGEELAVEASTAPIQNSTLGLPEDADARRGSVLVFRNVSERKRYRQAIEDLAFRDGLTGLPNRTSFLDRLGLEHAHARRHAEPMALFFLDLDGFKDVNDSFGHHVGDLLLQGVADRLRECVREGDTVARLGGDEFTVILSRIGSPANARLVAGKLVSKLSEPHTIEGHEIFAPPSIGIALYPFDADEREDLMRRADRAMYRAKELGGARLSFWTEGMEGSLFAVPRRAAR